MGWELTWLLKIAHGNGSSEPGPGPGRVPLALSPKEMLLVLHAAVIAAALLPQSNQGCMWPNVCFLDENQNLKPAAMKKGQGYTKKGILFVTQRAGWGGLLVQFCLQMKVFSARLMFSCGNGTEVLALDLSRRGQFRSSIWFSAELYLGFQVDEGTGKLTICPGPCGE